jgi:hypothetical protein
VELPLQNNVADPNQARRLDLSLCQYIGTVVIFTSIKLRKYVGMKPETPCANAILGRGNFICLVLSSSQRRIRTVALLYSGL